MRRTCVAMGGEGRFPIGMNLREFWEWLTKTHESGPVDLQSRARALVARYESSDMAAHLAADRTLREIGYMWETGRVDNVNWVVAVLDALAETGSGRALLYVEHLAQSKARTDAEKRIKAAAQACLPQLIERARQEQERDTLLRSTEKHKPTVAELLRPAQEVADAAPEQLLRPDLPLQSEEPRETKGQNNS